MQRYRFIPNDKGREMDLRRTYNCASVQGLMIEVLGRDGYEKCDPDQKFMAETGVIGQVFIVANPEKSQQRVHVGLVLRG